MENSYGTAIIALVVLMSQTLVLFPWQNASALSCSILVTKPLLQPLSGEEAGPIAGEQFAISTTITNPGCYEYDQPYVAIIEVRNSYGFAEHFGLQFGIIKHDNYTSQIGISWTPSHGDDFRISAFLVTNLGNPQLLSTFASSNITVAANPMADDDDQVYGRFSAVLFNLGINDKHYSEIPRLPVLISFETSGFGGTGIVFVEVRNSEGQTVHLSQTDVAFSIGRGTGIQWYPEERGKYKLRAFAIISLDDPRILTPVITSDIEVGREWKVVQSAQSS